MEDGRFIDTSKELLDFIEKSPSVYHVIANFSDILDEEGFVHLSEKDAWNIIPGGKYYVTRGESAIIAFRMPESNAFANFQIVASHSDSPSFKVKENPEIAAAGNYVTLNVEKYGGMLMAPWFDRPLSVAGRVVYKEGNTIKSKLVNVDRDLCMIPNLAIHMNREANDGYKYNAQKDMLPLIGDETAGGLFNTIIAEACELDVESIISSDLFLYNRQPGSIWGVDNEYISSSKLDDLMCAYSSMSALIESKPNSQDNVNVVAVLDNEEVGSTTKQGADSTFLSDVLERISLCSGKGPEEHKRALAVSFMLSADNAHAVHPNYTDKADPTNKPFMNKGIVIKFNANQKYTTDSVSASVFREICKRADVLVQTFVNKSDMAGGSTLGNISNSHVSVNTVDIGLAQLAMHSPYETAGIKDAWYMIVAVKEFFETAIVSNVDGTYTFI